MKNVFVEKVESWQALSFPPILFCPFLIDQACTEQSQFLSHLSQIHLQTAEARLTCSVYLPSRLLMPHHNQGMGISEELVPTPTAPCRGLTYGRLCRTLQGSKSHRYYSHQTAGDRLVSIPSGNRPDPAPLAHTVR